MRLPSSILIMIALTAPALAHAPDRSLMPVARPSPTLDLVGSAQFVMARSAPALPRMRPQQRPPAPQVTQVAARSADLPRLGPDVSLRPFRRPGRVEQNALFKRRKLRKGSVCGNIDIQGTKVGAVQGRVRGCGIEDAVRITSVSGVVLSTPAVMNCQTAVALNRWVDNGLQRAFRARGKVVEMKVAAHYACRTRNNQKGARISEHGRGNAIDLSAFTLRDGSVITVADGWNDKTNGRLLRWAWKEACGPFGTVLGPNADRFHRDHFHFDTARHRGGPYCR